jgi:hypothetical protein
MAHKISIVGVMRFSVLTPTYYAENFDTLEAIAEHLFAPQRMALRFHLFEKLALPSLMAQSDQDFQVIVLTAESLPEPHKARLGKALSDLPNIHVRAVGPDKHYQLIKEAYDALDLGDATHRVMFRLDDDDAVDLNYIRRLRRLATGLLQVQDPETPQVITFNRGVYLRLREGENEVFDTCERAPLSAGTALLAPVGYPRNPYRYNHRQLLQHYTTYSDISVPAFIRSIHEDNKSTPTQMGLTHALGPRALARQIRSHFGLTLSDLRAL